MHFTTKQIFLVTDTWIHLNKVEKVHNIYNIFGFLLLTNVTTIELLPLNWDRYGEDKEKSECKQYSADKSGCWEDRRRSPCSRPQWEGGCRGRLRRCWQRGCYQCDRWRWGTDPPPPPPSPCSPGTGNSAQALRGQAEGFPCLGCWTLRDKVELQCLHLNISSSFV